MKKSSNSTWINARVDSHLKMKFDFLCDTHEINKSEILRDLIQNFVDNYETPEMRDKVKLKQKILAKEEELRKHEIELTILKSEINTYEKEEKKAEQRRQAEEKKDLINGQPAEVWAELEYAKQISRDKRR